MNYQQQLRAGAILTLALALGGCQQTPVSAESADPAARKPVAAAVPAPRTVTIPAGTVVRVRTGITVSTKTNHSGDAVPATLETPITVNGAEVAPRGSDAQLVVATADDGGRVKGRAIVGLRLTSLTLSGTQHAANSSTFYAEAPGTKKKDAATVGILTGIGAAAGAIADGGRGAAIGAASGAGAGTAVVLSTKGAAAVLPSESVLAVTLQAPITITLR